MVLENNACDPVLRATKIPLCAVRISDQWATELLCRPAFPWDFHWSGNRFVGSNFPNYLPFHTALGCTLYKKKPEPSVADPGCLSPTRSEFFHPAFVVKAIPDPYLHKRISEFLAHRIVSKLAEIWSWMNNDPGCSSQIPGSKKHRILVLNTAVAEYDWASLIR